MDMPDMVGRRVHSIVGGSEVPLMITIMLVAALLSAFANNIADRKSVV
jgi:Na+/H+ antiporter NhaD/arsenite permease-like protein